MDLNKRIDLAFKSGRLPGLHSAIAVRGGEVIAERYYTGADSRWGQPLGEVTFGPETLHDLRSVTKSVTSLLYGIALGQRLVPGPEARLLESFPQYDDLGEDATRDRWTVAHVLDMTLGTEWNEDVPYTSPANSEIAMELAEDRYRFILERPIVAEPGTTWQYNGGCSALLGHLIEVGAGARLDAFAREALFGPLGIEAFEWVAGRDGALSSASGLRLRARDVVRVGQLVLAGGRWGDVQVVPASWIEAIRTPRVASRIFEYSHQWYVWDQPAGAMTHPTLLAIGNGGQRLFVVPSMDLVVNVFNGNYDQPEQHKNAMAILQEEIVPHLDG